MSINEINEINEATITTTTVSVESANFPAPTSYRLSVAMETVHSILSYGENVFGVYDGKDFRLCYNYRPEADTEDSTPCLLHQVPEIAIPVIALRLKARSLTKANDMDEDTLYTNLISEYLLMALAYLEEVRLFGQDYAETNTDSMQSMRAFQVRVVMKQLGLSLMGMFPPRDCNTL